MSRRWECNDDNEVSSGNEERMTVAADWTQFVLDLPMKGYAPWMTRRADSLHGRAFAYCTANRFMLGAIVERAAGQSLSAFSAAALEQPLGIGNAQWSVCAEGVAWAAAAPANAPAIWPDSANCCSIRAAGMAGRSSAPIGSNG